MKLGFDLLKKAAELAETPLPELETKLEVVKRLGELLLVYEHGLLALCCIVSSEFLSIRLTHLL